MRAMRCCAGGATAPVSGRSPEGSGSAPACARLHPPSLSTRPSYAAVLVGGDRVMDGGQRPLSPRRHRPHSDEGMREGFGGRQELVCGGSCGKPCGGSGSQGNGRYCAPFGLFLYMRDQELGIVTEASLRRGGDLMGMPERSDEEIRATVIACDADGDGGWNEAEFSEHLKELGILEALIGLTTQSQVCIESSLQHPNPVGPGVCIGVPDSPVDEKVSEQDMDVEGSICNRLRRRTRAGRGCRSKGGRHGRRRTVIVCGSGGSQAGSMLEPPVLAPRRDLGDTGDVPSWNGEQGEVMETGGSGVISTELLEVQSEKGLDGLSCRREYSQDRPVSQVTNLGRPPDHLRRLQAAFGKGAREADTAYYDPPRGIQSVAYWFGTWGGLTALGLFKPFTNGQFSNFELGHYVGFQNHIMNQPPGLQFPYPGPQVLTHHYDIAAIFPCWSGMFPVWPHFPPPVTLSPIPG